MYALCAWEKPIYDISDSYGSVYDLNSDISESEASIPSLEETLPSSPKFPLETSHFLLVLDVSSEIYFPLHLDPSYSDCEGDIQDYI